MDNFKIISHRGNLYGPDKDMENQTHHILSAIDKGFDVEIDIFIDEQSGKIFLGHDQPDNEIKIDWLNEYSKKLWIHCKNYFCLKYLITQKQLNIFWHDKDKFTLTSHNYIWAYPSKIFYEETIVVLPEWDSLDFSKKKFNNVKGVCTDYPIKIYDQIF